MRLTVTIVLALAIVLGGSSLAFGMEHEHEYTGREYGQHIKHHAQMQHFGQDENPGMHRGFKGFAEHHHDMEM